MATVTDNPNPWDDFLKQYTRSFVAAMREFGIEMTHDQVEKIVQEELVGALRRLLGNQFYLRLLQLNRGL